MTLDKMIAHCGLNCTTCLIHQATLEKDPRHQKEMRNAIAGICNDKYGMNVKMKDINDCDGCRAETGRLFFGCLSCHVRKCADNKHITCCALCPDYGCDILEEFLEQEPVSRKNLEALRDGQR